MKRSDIIERLSSLPFQKSDYWVVTGAAMVLHGLKEEARDIDLGCSSSLADELCRMGAKIQVTDGKVADFEGGATLSGAPVTACDLRAGAAFIIAGLAANGITEIDNIKHIQRGYEDIVGKLRGVGADIRLVTIREA